MIRVHMCVQIRISGGGAELWRVGALLEYVRHRVDLGNVPTGVPKWFKVFGTNLNGLKLDLQPVRHFAHANVCVTEVMCMYKVGTVFV